MNEYIKIKNSEILTLLVNSEKIYWLKNWEVLPQKIPNSRSEIRWELESKDLSSIGTGLLFCKPKHKVLMLPLPKRPTSNNSMSSNPGGNICKGKNIYHFYQFIEKLKNMYISIPREFIVNQNFLAWTWHNRNLKVSKFLDELIT